MKKLITLPTLVLACMMMLSIFGLQAQDAAASKEGFNAKNRFGIRVGANIAKQTFDEGNLDQDPEGKFGGDLAILANFQIGGGFFALQPELHWMQKGYKISDATSGGQSVGDVTSTLNYLELPVLLRFNFGGSLKLFAIGGPSAGYLLGGTIEDDNSETEAKDVLDDIEFGVHIGAGVGIGTFEIDVRYMAGLSDISNSEDLTDVKNSALGAGITLKF